MPDVVDDLLAYARSDKGGAWPLTSERPLLTRLNTWAAILTGDSDTLKRVAGWTDARRRYRVDPLGERIADAWAHYLFGDDPHVAAAAEADAGLLEAMLGTDFASELERGASLCVGEGEIWTRIYADPIVAPRPLLDWVSRRAILPLWVGVRLAAAAIVTEHNTGENDTQQGGKVVYRHFEIHAPGQVANRLFVGTNEKLGRLVDLEAHPATATLEPDWRHGLPGMLLDRIPNRLRADRRLGVSDFAGILDSLLDLNEAAVIGAHNMKLTARKRAIVSASALAHEPRGDLALSPEETAAGGNIPRARFDASEEVFVEDPLDGELGKTTSPFRILEYGFDADPLIAWTRHLVDTALSRVGLTGQYVGSGDNTAGYAISGTALRLRLIPTDKTGRGKGRYWDDGLPRILAMMAQLDALPDTGGGFSRQWTDPRTPPTVERRPGIPVDPVEEGQVHSQMVAAGIESRETAIRALHPDWTDDDVAQELDRIRQDTPPSAGIGSMTGF